MQLTYLFVKESGWSPEVSDGERSDHRTGSWEGGEPHCKLPGVRLPRLLRACLPGRQIRRTHCHPGPGLAHCIERLVEMRYFKNSTGWAKTCNYKCDNKYKLFLRNKTILSRHVFRIRFVLIWIRILGSVIWNDWYGYGSCSGYNINIKRIPTFFLLFYWKHKREVISSNYIIFLWLLLLDMQPVQLLSAIRMCLCYSSVS